MTFSENPILSWPRRHRTYAQLRRENGPQCQVLECEFPLSGSESPPELGLLDVERRQVDQPIAEMLPADCDVDSSGSGWSDSDWGVVGPAAGVPVLLPLGGGGRA